MSRRNGEKPKKLSPREAIWAWYLSVSIPKKRKPRGRYDLDKDAKTYRCVVHMDGEGRLVIGLWRGYRAERVGVYYMTESGLHHGTRDGENWTDSKYAGLDHNGDGYWYGDRYLIESEEPACRPWAVEVSKEITGYNHEKSNYDTLDIVDRIETDGATGRRWRAKRRRRDNITSWADCAPELPAGFDAWVRAVPFAGAHFLFFDKPRAVFGCSACGAEYAEKSPEAKAWRRGHTVTCPACGCTAKIIRDGVTTCKLRSERVMVVQSYQDRKGNACSVARHFCVEMRWEVGREMVMVEPTVIIALPTDGRAACDKDVYYKAWSQWSDKNPCQMRAGDGYCYPDLSALAGTAYTGMGLEVAAAEGWKMNWNGLMRDSHGDPRIEYLIKGGFRRLVADFARKYNPDYHLRQISSESIKATDIFGMDGQSVARLRQHDGGVRHLQWLKCCFGCLNAWKLPDAAWDFLAENDLTPQDCARMLDGRIGNLSPEQIVNYIQKQIAVLRAERGKSTGHYNPYGTRDVERVLAMWRDTLEMETQLKVDFSKSMNVRPKNLKARHDELVEILNAERNRLEAEAQEANFPEVKPICERIRSVYEWSDGEHKVVVPTGVFDIQREGRLLQHCVAANERYFDRMAQGESYILFLRRESAPDTPWYTMEVEPGGKIRQLRTTGDDDGTGADREEAKAFLRKWSREIRARLSPDDLRAAEIAREKRLRNFDELREGGNIIRNGRLAGKRLVDILERDFRELNEPETNEREEAVS